MIEVIRNAVIFYLLLPSMMVALIYLIKHSVSLLGLPWPKIFSHTFIVLFGPLLGAAYAHFMTSTNTASVARGRLVDRGPKLVRRTSYSVFVISCVLVYSIGVYPNLPRSLGGGKPDLIGVRVSDKNVLSDVARLTADMSTAGKREGVSYTKLYLIDLNQFDVILCRKIESPAACAVIPRKAVESFYWGSVE